MSTEVEKHRKLCQAAGKMNAYAAVGNTVERDHWKREHERLLGMRGAIVTPAPRIPTHALVLAFEECLRAESQLRVARRMARRPWIERIFG